jgi:hypothetical protein
MNIDDMYIKMCEKAPELWDGRKFEHDDCLYVKDSWDNEKDGFRLAGDQTFDEQLAFGGKWFIIFRKFQLQQMVKREKESWLALEKRFEHNTKNYPSSWTPEKIWLAFVMKENYNKVWNGYNWVPALNDKISHKKTK